MAEMNLYFARSALRRFLESKPSDEDWKEISDSLQTLRRDPLKESVEVPFTFSPDPPVRLARAGKFRILFNVSPSTGQIFVLDVSAWDEAEPSP